ncbi:MAG: tyrosine-type recombinase/integrase [Candidatus Bathyarchaeales archaeon]
MLADLERRRLKVKTIRNYRDALIVLGQQANLDDVDAVVTVVSRIKGRTLLDTVMAAYNHYSRFWKLSRAEYNIRRDRRRKLPILTPETTLQASLVIPHRLKWKAYFRLLYETGARASEPFSMTVADADPDHQKVRLGTAKGSGDVQERELPISPLLAEQLRELTRNKPPDTWLFTKTRSPTEPLNYHQAERLKAVIKKELISAGYNVRGYRLHVYRHAFATRLYWATKDLPLVSRSLGHRNLEDTMLYIHLMPDQPKRFDVESCGVQDKPVISKYIAEGWELALQTQETIYFKRPRWVP